MAKVVTYVPFNFMRGIFTSGSHFFDGKQIAVMLIWCFVLLLRLYPIIGNVPLCEARLS